MKKRNKYEIDRKSQLCGGAKLETKIKKIPYWRWEYIDHKTLDIKFTKIREFERVKI